METSALFFNWACWAAVVIGLGLTLTVARHTRWGRASSRLVIASYLAGLSAELVNLYTHARWAPFLFFLTAPFLVMALVAEIAGARRAARSASSSAAHIRAM
jgi:hypothetical protein